MFFKDVFSLIIILKIFFSYGYWNRYRLTEKISKTQDLYITIIMLLCALILGILTKF